ncbi:MAG: RNA polymerase sigma factor [Thiobacillaceae bacterium]|nr:RNA polymerase sigma factor [Thiobacillaceae bacterium]MDW8323423.1 RNA polymerase sigma factor [Burkholderiales bacterium]
MRLPWLRLWDASLQRELAALRPRLYRLAYAWCHDPHLADDLAQEALTRALAHGDQLKDAGRLSAWLFAILNNCWRDHLRARRDCCDVDTLDELIDEAQPGPEGAYASRQAADRVRAAIGSLPLAQRQVLTLVDLEGLSYAETAGVLGVPVGTVMSRLARARESLRERLLRPQAQGVALRRVK